MSYCDLGKKKDLSELLNQIFCKTLGIKPNKNSDRTGRGGNFPAIFKQARLGNAINHFKNEDSTPWEDDTEDYKAVICLFFETTEKNLLCEKTKALFNWLYLNDYLEVEEKMCFPQEFNINALVFYKELLLKIFDFYFVSNNTRMDNTQKYTITSDDLERLTIEAAKSNRMASWLYYQSYKDDIKNVLRDKDPLLYKIYDNDYIHLFQNILDNNRMDGFAEDEKKVFIDALYSFSDLLDQQHHKDSYKINLDILTFFNVYYKDDYEKACIDDIRKIQGCIYGIALNDSNEPLYGEDIELTPNKNIRRKEFPSSNGTGSLENNKMLNKCLEAMSRIEKLSIFNKITDSLVNSVKEAETIPNDILSKATVLSLVYSNIAAINMQSYKKRPDEKTKNVIESFQDKSFDIRINLLKYYNQHDELEKIEEAKNSLAAFFNTLAYRFWVLKSFDNCIVIRNALYSFFLSIGKKEKANVQLKKMPDYINSTPLQILKIAYERMPNKYKEAFEMIGIELTDFEHLKDLVKKYNDYYKLFIENSQS